MIVEDFGGSHGVRDENRLRSLVESPQLVAFGVEQYDTVLQKAAAYMRNCIADHVFVDGNKRTGTSLAAIFLARHEVRLTATPKELEDFAVQVAVEHLSVEDTARWFETHTDTMD